MKKLAICIALAASCTNRDPAPGGGSAAVVPSRALAEATMQLPQGWTSTYNAATDSWQMSDGRTTVRLERADDRFVASPDAFIHHVSARHKNKLVTIEHREHVNAGFAVARAVFTRKSDPSPLRATYVVRQLTRVWYQCYAEGIDETLRAQVIALCRSIRR